MGLDTRSRASRAEPAGRRRRDPSLWLRGTGGFFLLFLLRTRASENVRHRVVAFVAGVFEQRSLDSRHRQDGTPRADVRTRIGDREFVLDRIVVNPREALDDPRFGRGALQTRLSTEVDRLDDERLAFPPPA